MFAHVLVPLDGSALAEAVLPYIHALGASPGTRVTLLHLIEHPAPAKIHGSRHLQTVPDAEAYLAEIAKTLATDGIAANIHVDTNEGRDTAGRVSTHAAEWGADLVVMCAHGRSGIGRWLFGSIAQKVLDDGVAPVMLVLPVLGREPRPPVTLDRFLLPLDGTPDGETVLPVAAKIAGAQGGTVHLLMVVPTADSLNGAMASVARFSPNVTAELLKNAGADAVMYLNGLAARLQAGGAVVEATVERGDPATVIADVAKRTRPDAVLMASHGRAGLEGVWAGSVGNKVLTRTDGPFILVRAPGKPQKVG